MDSLFPLTDDLLGASAASVDVASAAGSIRHGGVLSGFREDRFSGAAVNAALHRLFEAADPEHKGKVCVTGVITALRHAPQLIEALSEKEAMELEASRVHGDSGQGGKRRGLSVAPFSSASVLRSPNGCCYSARSLRAGSNGMGSPTAAASNAGSFLGRLQSPLADAEFPPEAAASLTAQAAFAHATGLSAHYGSFRAGLSTSSATPASPASPLRHVASFSIASPLSPGGPGGRRTAPSPPHPQQDAYALNLSAGAAAGQAELGPESAAYTATETPQATQPPRPPPSAFSPREPLLLDVSPRHIGDAVGERSAQRRTGLRHQQAFLREMQLQLSIAADMDDSSTGGIGGLITAAFAKRRSNVHASATATGASTSANNNGASQHSMLRTSAGGPSSPPRSASFVAGAGGSGGSLRALDPRDPFIDFPLFARVIEGLVFGGIEDEVY